MIVKIMVIEDMHSAKNANDINRFIKKSDCYRKLEEYYNKNHQIGKSNL